jgi:acyl-activating enzyme 14
VEALIAACTPASGAPPLLLRRAPGDVVTLVFTSGTTGTPKAAALTHASFAAASAAKLAAVGYCTADVYLHAAPLCHVGGLSSAHALLCAGGRHVFLSRWSAASALAAMRTHAVSATALVPAMLTDLLAAADADVAGAGPLRAMRRVLLGGGAAPPALLAAAAQRLFPEAALSATYALSEGGSTLAFRAVAACGALLPPEPSAASHADAYGVCVGLAAPGIELAVALWPAGDRAPPGVQGELLARGPQVMHSYWQDEAATAGAFTWGGAWLRTGDIGALDAQGRVWLAGRAKDVIKSGGESVHASEVEAALCAHPAVAAAAAVGLPHARWGEQVAALVVLRPGTAWNGPTAGGSPADAAAAAAAAAAASRDAAAGASLLTPEALREFACGAGALSRFKAPRFVAAAASGALPTGAGGKVCKRSVREALLAAQAAEAAEQQPAAALQRLPMRSRL